MDQLREKVIEYAILLGISIALVIALFAYSPDANAKTARMPVADQVDQNPAVKAFL